MNEILMDVLDKIRAEIESQREEVSNKDSEDKVLLHYYFGLNDGLKDARDIIDKYKDNNMKEKQELLTTDERADVLNAINQILKDKGLNLEVAGCEDDDGIIVKMWLAQVRK